MTMVDIAGARLVQPREIRGGPTSRGGVQLPMHRVYREQLLLYHRNYTQA